MAYASSMAGNVEAILEGSSDPDSLQYGLTTEDERSRCNMGQVGWLPSTVAAYAAELSRMGATATQSSGSVELARNDRPPTPLPPLQWPGVSEAVRPPHAGSRLFGGAAFERCLNEFEEAANALQFPTGLAQPRVSCVIL